MGTMEPVEFGRRERKSRSSNSEMECSSPASTSYGGSSPSQGDNVGTPSVSDLRAERERKWKADKHGQSRRRSNASPGRRKSSETTEAQDSVLTGSGKVEGKSLNQTESQSMYRCLNIPELLRFILFVGNSIVHPILFKSEAGSQKHKGRQSLASKVCLNQKFIDALPAAGEESDDEDLDNLSNSKTFERLVHLSELEEEVLMLHKRLAEELELRAALECALERASGNSTSFPRNLPISAQELLANITLLEVAVLKLEEQSSILQGELGQARTEREIAELRHASEDCTHLKLQDSIAHPDSLNSDGALEGNRIATSSMTTIESQKQHSKTVAMPAPEGNFALQSIIPLDSPGEESDPQLSEVNWKEQRALTLRQDLRLTIPEVVEDDRATISWRTNHEYGPISDRQSRRFLLPWKHNPLEEEEHWIPLNDHHAQAMFAEADGDSPQDCKVDPCLLSVGLVAHEEDPPCFSPAIIAETLLPQSPVLADLADQEEKSFIPVAEVLWKPAATKPLVLLEPLENEKPGMAVPATKPESWSFTSEDDHPLPESGSVPHSMIFEDQSWAQVAEAPSVDEQRMKYRIGVLKVREQRRQGNLEKSSEKVKSLGISDASSISSAKSGVPLSPIWSPVDTGAENEDGYESQETVGEDDGYELSTLSKTPNELSEQMVRCMISIYRHLADPNTTKELSPSGSTQSPTSPFAVLTNSSASSLSQSSLLSVARSPLVDLRSKEEVLGNDSSPDPYKSRGKLPWAEIGPYTYVLEVSWLSVGKDQLEFAAQALRNFKILVEQLSRVDPSSLQHEEKLAFWINLYNALLMHAYLAYGIPRSDLKFLSLLQKAAYTVGGHSFNAATMEFCLLKSKSTSHRPQLTLLMALHKNRLSEDQIKFGIDHPEPLTVFALCSGTRSSPMVRVYTPKHVKSQLEDALHDYTRAAVGISAKGRLLVPKLLYTYAREFIEDADLLDWICNLLPSNQVAMVFDCVQQRRHRILGSRNFNILPIDFTFRYLFPAEMGPKMVL